MKVHVGTIVETGKPFLVDDSELLDNVWQWKVRDFNLSMGQEVGQVPQWPATLHLYLGEGEALPLYGGLLQEELDEIRGCALRSDLSGFADNLVDLIYVTLGLANASGIDLAPLFLAVHEANMRKAGGGLDARGKAQKPEGWKPADVRALLVEQGWKP